VKFEGEGKFEEGEIRGRGEIRGGCNSRRGRNSNRKKVTLAGEEGEPLSGSFLFVVAGVVVVVVCSAN
jgi:hypothetical protein